MWTPDVYEGAPTTVTTFMAACVTAAAIGALLRVFDYGLASHWQPLVAALAVVTMVVGNLAALAQISLKRLLAYSSIAHEGREPASVADLAGLSVFLVSLTGIPVTAGFVGKFYLFNAAVSSGWVVLALVGVLTSVVSAYYYLRMVVAMYMEAPLGEDRFAALTPAAALALTVSAAATLLFGLWPAPVLTLARLASKSLL